MSSKPALHASTILPTAFAYLRPCSPSKTTPEWRMIDGGDALERRSTPSTVLWDDNFWSVCSSSGDVAACEDEKLGPVVDVAVVAYSNR